MQTTSIILGHRRICRHCGEPIRLAIIFAMHPTKWQVCEDMDDEDWDGGVIELHECSQRTEASR